MMKTSNEKAEITKKELNRVFWRSFQMEFSWNYERQMNLAYVYAMIPILKKLYKTKESMADALKRHLEFFNTTPHIVTLILGINAAMEEENVNDPNFDSSAIDNIKTSLMGPLAGIGDSFFWGTLRLIATGVGTSLALQGNILGPILFLLIFNIPHLLFRYFATGWGYKLGTGFLKKIQENGMMESLTYGAAIIGLMVVGGMTATMIDINIPLQIGSGENAVTVQSIFDDIVPKILSLGAFGAVFYLLKKRSQAVDYSAWISSSWYFGILDWTFLRRNCCGNDDGLYSGRARNIS